MIALAESQDGVPFVWRVGLQETCPQVAPQGFSPAGRGAMSEGCRAFQQPEPGTNITLRRGATGEGGLLSGCPGDLSPCLGPGLGARAQPLWGWEDVGVRFPGVARGDAANPGLGCGIPLGFGEGTGLQKTCPPGAPLIHWNPATGRREPVPRHNDT